MPLISVLANKILDECTRPMIEDLYDQNFGLGLLDNVTIRPSHTFLTMPLRCGYIRPWRSLEASDSGLSSLKNDKNEFKVSLDVQQFKPEELKVKVEGDYIVIDGKHEERKDEHGFVSREFRRRYKVPKDVDANGIKSNLSSDGILSLTAPKKKITGKGREIPITHTNAPAVKKRKSELTANGEKMEE